MKMKRIYYNEIEPFAVEWMRELIKAGEIPDGDIDTRSIKDVSGDDIKDYDQCHFFAGIGGWPLALKMAGWPNDVAVWTGSCPCQPFSAAGKRKGTADDRHLWPEFARLINECNPPAVFGEQVASKDGREWLSVVFTDLEGMGYAAAGADLCAAGVGAPHIRQRLYWMAYAESNGQEQGFEDRSGSYAGTESQRALGCLAGYGGDNRMGDTDSDGSFSRSKAASTNGHWYSTNAANWDGNSHIECRDGKARPVVPGVRLLAHGFPNRVGLLRGFGNAIVPQVAAEFIASAMDVLTSKSQ